jgi:hypothetical protein
MLLRSLSSVLGVVVAATVYRFGRTQFSRQLSVPVAFANALTDQKKLKAESKRLKAALLLLRGQLRPTLLADTRSGRAFSFVTYARIAAGGANQGHVRNIDGRLVLRNSALRSLALFARNRLLNHAHMLYQYSPVIGKDTQHAPCLTTVSARKHCDRIVAMNTQTRHDFSEISC